MIYTIKRTFRFIIGCVLAMVFQVELNTVLSNKIGKWERKRNPQPEKKIIYLVALTCFVFFVKVGYGQLEFSNVQYRGFDIPQIELENFPQFQTIVDKDTSIYLGHPSSIISDDGDTITMMYLTGHALGNIRWVRSFDSGISWTKPQPVPPGWNDLPDTVKYKGYKVKSPFTQIPTLYNILDRSGEKRTFMYTGVFTPRAGKNFPSRYSVSEDGGKSWSHLKPLLFNGEKLSANVLFADMIRLANGRYLGTFHYEDQIQSKREGRVYAATTEDGFSFSKPRLVAEYPGTFLCEAGLIRGPDEKTIAMLMRENNRLYNSMVSFSSDEGQTWSKPMQLPDALTGDRHQGLVLPDGRLFISFRDMGAGSPTRGDWVGWIGTFDDLKNAEEGQYRVHFRNNKYGYDKDKPYRRYDCAYTTMHLLPDSTVFVATYGHWDKGQPPYIIAFRFKIEEIDKIVEKSKNQ